ncbi:MAG TPA: inverse autotransporter beta domain-containing protein [Chlamydiales bacterium]|nr:inverse autotransporter beta domain-containing protein [Chlamydiales bacterium]
MPFVDLRGHIFDDGKWAANGGIGLRSLLGGRVFGAYVYYDYRNTKHKNIYNQISFGLETLGNWWDVRVNGYVPIGSKESSAYDLAFSEFAGNNAFVTQKFEYALAGANGEIGGYLVKWRDGDLYAAAGPYYLKGTLGDGIWGGEVRFRGTYKTWLALEANYSYDHVFKNIVQGQVAFSYAFGPKCRIKKDENGCCRADVGLYNRMVSPVVKNEIIPVNHKKVESVAIDPATGEPYFFWFVDNTSHSAGTYESPFSTLVAAQNASATHDIIYVFPGDLTTTGMAAGITLKNYQKLWGSAIPHTLNTTVGSVQIPSFSSGLFQNTLPSISIALVPIITSSVDPSDVVILANNNEISGLYIQNTFGSGLTGSSITNLTITHNIIQGPDTSDVPGGYGISLNNVLGTVLIDSNMIFQGNVGVNIVATDIQNANYIISNNNAPSIGAAGGFSPPFGNFLVTTYTNSANISTTISGNAFSVSNTPIGMTFLNATAQQACSVDINNNTIHSDSASSGASLLFTLSEDANVNLSIVDNELNTPYADGVSVTQSNNSQLNIQMENNVFSTWNSSISFTLGNSSNLSGSIANNSLLFDESSGILAVVNGNSTISSLSITNNIIEGVLQSYSVSSDSIGITTNSNATATLNISANVIQGGSSGVSFITNNSSNMTASLINNTVSNTQLYGMIFTANNSSTGVWTVDQNTIVAVGAGSQFATSTGSVVVTSNGTSTTYLDFNNNLSAPIELSLSGIGSYQFTNNGATFHLRSNSGNTGVITETGAIGP